MSSVAAVAGDASAAELPELSVADPGPIPEGDSGWQTVSISVDLSAPATEMVSADVVLSYDTAGPADLFALTRFLRIPPGASHDVILLQVNGDRDVEGDEHAVLRLANVVGATPLTTELVVVIEDDDAAPPVMPQITIGDAPTITEGGPGTSQTAQFPVALSAPTSATVSVRYLPGALDNIDPSKGDFDVTDGTVTFPPGDTSATIEIEVFGDDVWEQDFGEIRVDLVSPVNATIADARGIVRVLDDDPRPTATIEATPQSVAEGETTVQIEITMSNPTNRNQKLRLVRTGSADSGDATLPLTATVLDRRLTRVVDLVIHDDDVAEPDETVQIELESVLVAYMDGRDISADIGSPSVATVTILDDDRLPPETSIDDSPATLIASSSASISFSSDDPSASFECDLDTGGFAPCVSPTTLLGLDDGLHRFSVRATSAGLTDATPAMAAWTVDATAPVLAVDVPADGAIFTVGDVVTPVVSCIDAGDPAPVVTVGSVDTSTTSSAPRIFTATCRDAAGNAASAQRSYTVSAPPQAAYGLSWSRSANRSDPQPLPGALLSGDVAIMLSNVAGAVVTSSTGITKVTYRLSTGAGRRLVCTSDRAAPYDVIGSLGNQAIRLPTALLANGSYRLDAEISRPAGPSIAVTSSFVVDNGRRGPIAQLLGAWLAAILVGTC